MRKRQLKNRKVMWGAICTSVCVLAGVMSATYWESEYGISQDIQSSDNKSGYNIKQAINETYENLSDEKVDIIKPVEIDEKKVAFIFEGKMTQQITSSILEILNEYQYKADFFLTAKQIAENEHIVRLITQSGNRLGSLGLDGMSQVDQLSLEELVEDLSISSQIITTATKENTTYLRINETTYTDKLLEVARASGYRYLIESNITFTEKSFKTYESTLNYIKKLNKGSIISFALNEKTDMAQILEIIRWTFKAYKELGYEVIDVNDLYLLGKASEIGASTIKEINETLPQPVILPIQNSKDETKTEKREEGTVELPINIGAYVKQNSQKQIEPLKMFLTTQKAVSFTFRGIDNDAVVKKVLDALEDIGAKGTFFVTKQEVEQYPNIVELIKDRGHEIGNGGVTSHSKLLDLSVNEIVEEIYVCHMALNKIGIQATSYMPGYGYVNESIKEAMSVIKGMEGLEGYECVTYAKAPILSQYKGLTPEELVRKYLDPDIYPSLRRGDIVFFRMDTNIFEEQEKIADVVKNIADLYVKNANEKYYHSESNTYFNKSFPLNYEITTINELSTNKVARYELQDNIQFVETVKSEDEINQLIQSKYIGNIYRKDNQLIGFDEEQKKKVDITGTIKTGNKQVLFLTFDDWGSDAIVNSILDVLEKHQVKATFFVIGKNIDLEGGMSNVNPNLLRAIGEAGHDIASHTYSHTTLDSKEVVEDRVLEKSTSLIYNNFYKIVGELDCVRNYLRPPELAISKEGLQSAFKAGYEFVVSGNFSTHDYEVESAEELLKNMNDYLEWGQEAGEGNVFIMHMNDQSVHTAAAIDLFINQHQDEYEFAKLSDYLNESYIQGE